MFKAIIFSITLAASTIASAALLDREVESGMKKICIYTDGTTITVNSYQVCPMSK